MKVWAVTERLLLADAVNFALNTREFVPFLWQDSGGWVIVRLPSPGEQIPEDWMIEVEMDNLVNLRLTLLRETLSV